MLAGNELMRRKICVVTGTRAEYGLLRWVMEGVHQAPGLALQLLVTGTHLSPEFGLTYRESAGDGLYNGVLCDGTGICSAQTTINVRRSMVIVTVRLAEGLMKVAPPEEDVTSL